jgi:lipoate-protein ligase A
MSLSSGDTSRGSFPVIDRVGSPAELLELLPHRARLSCIAHPLSKAVVLGSAQRATDIDEAACEAEGYDILRRRSGGGAVLVAPGDQVWLDVFVPVSDPLFNTDVHVATYWLGELWKEVLSEVVGATAKLSMHRGKAVSSAWSSSVCFSGLGPGEITVDGYKVVGVSQRRSRYGAWLFSLALVNFDPLRLARMIAPHLGDKKELVDTLSAQVKGLGFDAWVLEDVLRRHLGGVA